MFIENRDDARAYFIKVRRKYNENQPLEPLEQLILDVILAHPEYHSALDPGLESLKENYSPEAGNVNPFLHMSMHIAIKEQIQSDRPPGIRELCAALRNKYNDPHEMEHKVMDCLGESLWLAQRNKSMPDESAYLENIRALK
ncbi:MAG: hypothetical protein ACI9SC_000459 [Gammaproteobacteria bacterium]|jgi:hypothetical protein